MLRSPGSGRTCAFTLVLTAGVLLAAPAPGRERGRAAEATPDDPSRLVLRGESPRAGLTRLTVQGPGGARVSVDERLGDTTRRIGVITLGEKPVALRPAVRWRCERRTRRFEARTRTADGQEVSAALTVRTASCRHRLAITWTRRVVPGQAVMPRVRDRWALGDLRARVCATPPGGVAMCSTTVLGGRAAAVGRPRRALRPGRWRLSLEVPGLARMARRVLVARPGGRLTLLATGDSQIQLLDTLLASRLRGRRVGVRSDAHVSTGISKPAMFNWVRHAGRVARRTRPDVTVVFLGANDGFALRVGRRYVMCCSPAWTDAYARLARRMMVSFARGGAGRVYWFLLPAPRGRRLAGYFAAINTGFRRAAATLSGDVRLIDAPRVFTPNGRFRSAMRYRGRLITVRESDGYHLSPAGDRIAAGLVIGAMRQDGILP